MTTDTALAAYREALVVCGSLVTKPENAGAPILVCTLERQAAVVCPAREVLAGSPVIELVVQVDGVVAISGLRLCPHVRPFAAAFFPYPTGPDGVPDLWGWRGALWREAVDAWVTAALPLLPSAGTPAGP